MNWQFSKSKISSGRFLLTVAAAFCFCWMTGTFSRVIIAKIDQLKVQDILPYLATLMVILSNIFTFYFTKKSENGNTDHNGSE